MVKLGQIVSPPVGQALNKLANSDIPVLTAWRLKAIIERVDKEAATFEELRRKLVDKHSTKDADGNIVKDEKGAYKVPEEAIPAFTAEINELLTAEVDVPSIKISSLGDKATMKAAELAVLDGLIVE